MAVRFKYDIKVMWQHNGFKLDSPEKYEQVFPSAKIAISLLFRSVQKNFNLTYNQSLIRSVQWRVSTKKGTEKQQLRGKFY